MPSAATENTSPISEKRRNRKSLPLIALNLAIVLTVAGGTAAYGAMSHTVTLTVDGKSDKIRTFGDNVSDVLAAKDVTVRTGDRLSKPASAALSDGDVITVSYAKPVTLAVDGTVTEHTVYDRTVADAFDTLGVEPAKDAYVSAKRGSVVPRKGMDLVVSSSKSLTVIADGEKKTVTSAAPTVAGVLKAADISMGADDEVKPGKDAYVKPDADVRVVRIKKVTKTETVPVKYSLKVQKDPEAVKGVKTVVQEGKPGEKSEKVTLVYADGKVRERIVLVSRSLSDPRPQIEKHGTKTAPSVASGSVWDKIAKCESGGNWSINTGNGYYGGLQFSAATWRSVGGPGLPHQHSRETQIKYAKILQARSGWGQWGCAHARFN
ncbi:resuscitation-promoting factor [Aeromicrobium sp. A1-2]|uniref:resuscitation-promoting factor n=1 Tax=Aeromicrobium sp. A1-2 TaxID=2107713 RepID=UPI0013C370EE|nr:resuscitation-promoting factor [Aeromicrobium sp. A1-2]